MSYLIDVGSSGIDPSTLVLSDNGVNYSPQKNGYYNAPAIVPGPYLDISSPQSNSGTNPDGSATDRFEYILCSEFDPICPKFDGQSHTQGFNLLIPDSVEYTARQGVVVAQWWQGSGADKDSPPVYLYLQHFKGSRDPWEVSFCIKNDTTGYEIGNAPVVVWKGTHAVGTWAQYSFTVKPSFQGTGQATISLNGVQQAMYTGSVGYNPNGLSKANSVFRVKFGLYRPNGNPAMSFGFSGISYQ